MKFDNVKAVVKAAEKVLIGAVIVMCSVVLLKNIKDFSMFSTIALILLIVSVVVFFVALLKDFKSLVRKNKKLTRKTTRLEKRISEYSAENDFLARNVSPVCLLTMMQNNRK